MALKLRKFQLATVEAATAALTEGSRRFLLADEVGLGKTVVARDVISRLAEKAGGRQFRVFYFGSGRTVTAQNARRLRPDKVKLGSALCEANRPSLIPMNSMSKEEVLIFQFTPETAVPRVHGRGRAGVALERALLRVLLSYGLHYKIPMKEEVRASFLGSASKRSFARALKYARNLYRTGNLLRGSGFTEKFLSSARETLAAKTTEELHKKLNDAFERPRECIATLRLILTKAALACVPPDLIVFDEFHKYRDRVISYPGEADYSGDVFLSFLPKSGQPPAILLLSATPFYQQSGVVDAREGDADDFYRLVGFLHGAGKPAIEIYDKCRRLFSEFEQGLLSPQRNAALLEKVRGELQNNLLRPRIARMERHAFRSPNYRSDEVRSAGMLPTRSELDFLFRFASGLNKKDYGNAISYWKSVPLPHQFLSGEYAARKRLAAPSRWKDLLSITREQRRKLRMRRDLPLMRLGNLLEAFPPALLALPWSAPSLPWWKLRGPWASAEGAQKTLEKGLLFSHYRATPRAVAGLVSFAVEDWAARSRGWNDSTRLIRQSFLSPKSASVVGLFHPSLWLAQVVDPLEGVPESTLTRKAVDAIKSSLPPSVPLNRKSNRRRPPFEVLLMIERESGRCPDVFQLWRSAVGGGGASGQVARALQRVKKSADQLERFITSAELNALAEFAVSSPGTVLLRALSRNWADAQSNDALVAVADLSWNGLRPYLDRPWFVARLMKGKRVRGYPDAVQRAVIEGNLESVLDEHFWLPDPDHDHWLDQKGERGRISALRDTLGIRSAPIATYQQRGTISPVKLSAHVALPMTDTEAQTAVSTGVQKLRADDLRRAFNTPFWPHLLCTTSVGQEGLDFHLWCRRIVHWDVCHSPTDVEQREGRIDRYKCLAVRRALAANQYPERWNKFEEGSRGREDDSGLAPWWVCDSAILESLYLDPPSSDERARRERLARLREVYRLVLGLPHHADMAYRIASSEMTVQQARSYCLDLGSYRRKI